MVQLILSRVRVFEDKAPFSIPVALDKSLEIEDGALLLRCAVPKKTRHGLPFFGAQIKGRCGIYAIVNTKNGNHYVGQSIDMAKRRIGHLKALRANKHGNPHLQNSFNVHGVMEFAFTVLEYVPDTDELNDRERYWIEEIGKSHTLYNVVLDPGKWVMVRWAHEPEGAASWQYTDEWVRPDWHSWVYGHGKNPYTRGRKV